ncbi:MAG: hypothetical protein B6244_10280 [Candidatus Cloacimonetes bacterium 4572_55]|nr:MAG: hypothetical protein B6244_10280 [Candidatus Cloacimonetes bacterium 4572_55]
MKLPNAEKAFADIEKLSGYCLNPVHERGKHKARLFASILGLTTDNAEELRERLLDAARNDDAEVDGEDRYGKRYLIDFTMTTAKGRAKVRSTWIVRTRENFARLTSCYILKGKEPNK